VSGVVRSTLPAIALGTYSTASIHEEEFQKNCAVATLLITSPQNSGTVQRWKDWEKHHGADKTTMPLPSAEDIINICGKYWRDEGSAREKVRECIAVVGLNIRECIHAETRSIDAVNKEFTRAIHSLDRDTLERLFTGNYYGNLTSRVIVDDVVRNDKGAVEWNQTFRCPASLYVAKLPLSRYDTVFSTSSWAQVRNSHLWTGNEIARGKLFEALVFELFKAAQKRSGAASQVFSIAFPAFDLRAPHQQEVLYCPLRQCFEFYDFDDSALENQLRVVAEQGSGHVGVGTKSNLRSFDALAFIKSDTRAFELILMQMSLQRSDDHAFWFADVQKMDVQKMQTLVASIVGGNAKVQTTVWYAVPLDKFLALRSGSATLLIDWKDMAEEKKKAIARVHVKVACIDTFDALVDSIIENASGVDTECFFNIRNVLLGSHFLRPLGDITAAAWVKVDGIGPAKAAALVTACQNIGPNLRRWMGFAEQRALEEETDARALFTAFKTQTPTQFLSALGLRTPPSPPTRPSLTDPFISCATLSASSHQVAARIFYDSVTAPC